MDDSLLEGAVKFMEDGFLEHEELFKSLQHKQDPHTLFISCVDSRVVASFSWCEISQTSCHLIG